MHRERYVSPVLALPGRCLIKLEVDQSWETATQRRPNNQLQPGAAVGCDMLKTSACDRGALGSRK